jgi:hypothetical protein
MKSTQSTFKRSKNKGTLYFNGYGVKYPKLLKLKK